MNIVIIGAGVVGVATAYYLSEAGFNVTVIDKREQAGLETSVGNAGLISPSDAFAWASPASLKLAITSIFNPDLGIRFKPQLDPMLWRWSAEFMAQCTQSKWEINSDIKYRMAAYSLELIKTLRQETGISFDELDNGIAFATRDENALQDLKKQFSFLADRGLALEHLDREQLQEKIPALRTTNNPYAGAIYSPGCMTGDSAKFSQALARWCESKGRCQFKWQTSVESIAIKNNRVTSLWTNRGEIKADAYVLAAGPYSGILANSIGLRVPIYPVKGFSISAPLINKNMAPNMGFDDTDRLVTATPLGDRLRLVSSAVFDGFNCSHKPDDFHSILKLAQEIFPDAADYEKAEYWAGLRPMTPSSVSILGKTPLQNLFMNTGHGHLGWTMACGTARVLADILTGKKPAIDPGPFQLKP